jgi:hypothetical protein
MSVSTNMIVLLNCTLMYVFCSVIFVLHVFPVSSSHNRAISIPVNSFQLVSSGKMLEHFIYSEDSAQK